MLSSIGKQSGNTWSQSRDKSFMQVKEGRLSVMKHLDLLVGLI